MYITLSSKDSWTVLNNYYIDTKFMFSIILYIITDMYLAMLTGIIVLWTCSLRTNKLWGVNHQQQDISRCYINHPR